MKNKIIYKHPPHAHMLDAAYFSKFWLIFSEVR